MLWWVAALDDGVSGGHERHGRWQGPGGGDNVAPFAVPSVRLHPCASSADHSHDDGSILGHVLAANDVDLGEEGDNGPGGNAAQRAVEEVGVSHDGGQKQARSKPPGLLGNQKG